MSAVSIVAFGAVSGLGRGADALGVVSVGHGPARAVARDEELASAGLSKPYCARADVSGSADRATSLLMAALQDCARELDERVVGWRARRVGLVLGTSSGGMRTFEQMFRDRVNVELEGWSEGTYLGPVLHAPREIDVEPFSLVLGACASSVLAIGVGRAWLQQGRCDLVLAGGFDAVGVFVAAGFEVLRATSGQGEPRPFRRDRDGLVLGEGAVVLALTSADEAVPSHGSVVGFGASCDAVHLTAPDRTGAGLARAARQALEDAGRPVVDRISAHGTATDFNDASEAHALTSVLGAQVLARTPIHAFKGSIGHTLGAAGGLETLSALAAMRAGVALPSVGTGPVIDGVRVLSEAEPNDANVALKLSAAFGGANAALVLATRASVTAHPPPRAVYVGPAIALDGSRGAPVDARRLAERTGYTEDKIARTDLLVRLTMAAVAKLDDEGPSVRGAGIVVGLGLATVDTNTLFLDRIVQAGAARAEPRRFPFTTPNAAAGETAIAFGLTGPAFAVGGGSHGGIEAIAMARTLVAAGVAERIVVVAVDEGGEGSQRLSAGVRPGAVALLVSSAPIDGGGLLEDATVRLEARTPDDSRVGIVSAHAPLLPLVERAARLDVETSWGIFGSVRIAW